TNAALVPRPEAGMTPIATGRPGLMATRQNTSRPTASTACRTWSASPVETPPEGTTRACSPAAAAIARASRSGSSGRLPRSVDALDEPREQIAIGVEQLGTRSRRSRLDDLVAGREQGDAHAAEYVERGQADGGRESDVLGGEPPARRQHDRSGAHVLACEASI